MHCDHSIIHPDTCPISYVLCLLPKALICDMYQGYHMPCIISQMPCIINSISYDTYPLSYINTLKTYSRQITGLESRDILGPC